MDCISPIESWSCFVTTASILFPLVVISWLVGMMIAAAIIKAERKALIWIGSVLLPLGFVSVLAVAIIFAVLEVGGLYELLVGPAIVFGEAAGLARIANLRAGSAAAAS